MHHAYVARRLTKHQRDMLFDHISEGRFVASRVIVVASGSSYRTRATLIEHGLIRFRGTSRVSTSTLITPDGRKVVGVLLGWYADALTRAGFHGLEPPKVLTLPDLGFDDVVAIAPVDIMPENVENAAS